MHIEDLAERVLRAAASEDPKRRRGRFAQFMQIIEDLVNTPGDRASFVARTAALIPAARIEHDRWVSDILRATEGGEEAVLEALEWRTQLEYARELYRGPIGDQFFEHIMDDEGDAELRERAEQHAWDRPNNVPVSHHWWRAHADGVAPCNPRTWPIPAPELVARIKAVADTLSFLDAHDAAHLAHKHAVEMDTVPPRDQEMKVYLSEARAMIKNGVAERPEPAQLTRGQSITFASPRGDRCIVFVDAQGNASIEAFLPTKKALDIP